MCLRSAQIIFFVCLLRSRLILVIKELKDIQNLLNIQSNDINRRKSVGRDTRIQLVLLDGHSIYDRLLSLKQIYAELYRSCEQIRKAFGFSLLVITTQAFVEFTTNSYWGYLRLNDFKVFFIHLFEPQLILVGVLAFYCSSCHNYVS